MEYKELVREKRHAQANTVLWGIQKKDQQLTFMEKRFFEPFQESFIEFPPTYKMQRFTDKYASSAKKVRIPSWTDRILTHCKNEETQDIYNYDSMEVYGSDHRPVYLLTKCKVIKKKI